jgi:hypothetical protein
MKREGDTLRTDSGTEFKLGPALAYQGKEDCVDPLCTRRMGPDGEIIPGCIGWHCPVCHKPCSMMGHAGCSPERTR